MNNVLCISMVCVGIAIGAMTAPLAHGQSLKATSGAGSEAVKPRQPGGLLNDLLGIYLTIEGVKAEGIKMESNTLLVDTVNGRKLDKPIPLVIRGASVANHNLLLAALDLPAKQRCVLKGFETGEMIGIPPAVDAAAKALGWTEVPMSPVQWQWRPHFVTLVVVEPKGLELLKH